MTNLIKRLFSPPTQSFFLFGPRGTGKSTLMRERFSDALWLDLLDADLERLYSTHPEQLLSLMAGEPDGRIVVIDEVQKAPRLLDAVHKLIEQHRGFQFVLTGSSARKLSHAGANLLAGRALDCQMHPFMATELGSNFSLERALEIGMLPLMYDAKNASSTMQTYVNLYLKEEIQTEGLVRSLESFRRFLQAITFSHAATLNTTNIGRECGVKRGTVENYIAILEDLLLAYKLPVFTRRAQRALSAHPKIYLFDAGVFSALRPRSTLDRPEEIHGAALEGLVAQHLRAWNGYSSEKYEIAFWRTRSQLEVDFIVNGPNGFWAIEVKNAAKVYPADLKPLQAFLEDYPEATGILLYRGKDRLRVGGIWCIPCEEFLLQLQPDQPLWL